MEKLYHLFKFTTLGIIAIIIYAFQLSELLSHITIFIFSTCLLVDLLLLLNIHMNKPVLYKEIQQEKFFKPEKSLKTQLIFDLEHEIPEKIKINRYHKQELYHQIGSAKQSFLKEKTIVIIGLGSLGTITAELLSRAGIGKIHLIDNEKITPHDIKYGPLYSHKNLNKSKVEISEKKLQKINSDINIIGHSVRLHSENIPLLKSDVVLDCTSDIKTKLKINKYCIENQIPLITCSISKNQGYIFPVQHTTTRLECLT